MSLVISGDDNKGLKMLMISNEKKDVLIKLHRARRLDFHGPVASIDLLPTHR